MKLGPFFGGRASYLIVLVATLLLVLVAVFDRKRD